MIITNDLLEEKVRIQKKLNDAANGDLEEYVKITHKIVLEFEKRKNKTDTHN